MNIYEIRSGPEELRWFWALHFPGRPENLRTDNRAGSLEAAKKEFGLARDNLVCRTEVVCSHVSGLLMQPKIGLPFVNPVARWSKPVPS